MDANEVIEGIEHFYGNILPKAHSSSNWDDVAITNAVHWAQFCEQIYESYKDKPREKLEDLIHCVALHFKDVNHELCFEDLKRSSSVLYEAFCENPSVEKDLIKSSLLRIECRKDKFEDINRADELNSLCVELLEVLKPIKIVGSDRHLYYEVKAELFLNMLKDSTLHMTTEEQVEKYLSDALGNLCETKDEMVLLLHVLMHRIPNGNQSSVSEIQEFSINWTIFRILSDENHPFAQFIWRQPSKLRLICLNSSDFLKFYLDFLTNCSSSLKCEMEGSEMMWIPRSYGSRILSFDEILSHFRSLLSEDDDVCESTKKHLLHLLDTQPDMVIWKEVFCRVT